MCQWSGVGTCTAENLGREEKEQSGGEARRDEVVPIPRVVQVVVLLDVALLISPQPASGWTELWCVGHPKFDHNRKCFLRGDELGGGDE